MDGMVLKFGGSSMADLQRINRAADIIIQTKQEAKQIVVVVSAMGGETDRLITLAEGIQSVPDDREYSVLVSTGEQVAMSLLAMALKQKGHKACSLTGMQAGIKTSDQYRKARIDEIKTEVLDKKLLEDNVVIVAGFQGGDAEGNITTLGRGGSDTSAVALAAALKAKECRIYTDVDGVYTTDPRVVPEARRLSRITFEEMLEMASLGAKVLQIRSVEFAGRYNVPLRVLSSFKEGPGTLISYEDKEMEHALVSGIAFNRTEAKITLMDIDNKPGVAAKIMHLVSSHGIDIDIIIQNLAEREKTDLTFTVHREDYKETIALLEKSLQVLGVTSIKGDDKIAKLSLVGVGMRSYAGIASQMFDALAKEGINIQLISTSEIKISVIIEEKYIELGVRALHSAFGLDKAPIEEFDPIKR